MKNSTRQNKASSLLLAVIMICSMVAAGFAAAPAAAATLSDDYDRNAGDTSGVTLFQGQEVAYNVTGVQGSDNVELREVNTSGNTPTVGSLQQVLSAGSGDYVIIDTSNLETGQYVLTRQSFGDNVDVSGQGDIRFEVVVQDLTIEFSKDSVSNNEDTELDVVVSSATRNNYVVTFAADGLSEDDLEELFNTTDNKNVTDTYVDNGKLLRSAVGENTSSEDPNNYILTENAIHVFRPEEKTALNFEGIGLGRYEFTADVLDSTAQDAAQISVLGNVIGPGDPPQYNLTLENDGTAYAVGFPGATDDTLNDVFTNGFDGVNAVYEYDANANSWTLLTGDDFNEPLTALDAVVVVTAGDEGPNNIALEVVFTNESVTSPTSRTLSEGWAFTTASTADDAKTVFDRGNAEVTVVLDAFAGPEVLQEDTAQSFQSQQPTPYYDLGTGDPPQMSPFAGYFVHVTESGSHPSLLSGIETRQESDAALNLTYTS